MTPLTQPTMATPGGERAVSARAMALRVQDACAAGRAWTGQAGPPCGGIVGITRSLYGLVEPRTLAQTQDKISSLARLVSQSSRPLPAQDIAGLLRIAPADAKRLLRLARWAAGMPRLGGSWQLPAAYVRDPRTPIIWTRAGWLRAVEAWLASTAGARACRAAHLATTTALTVAQVDAATANRDGTSVATAHATVGARIGKSARQVRAARTILERAGLSVTVTPGRYLTVPERVAAHQQHGGWQVRAASTRRLTMPPALTRGQVPGGVTVVGSPMRHLLSVRQLTSSIALALPPRPARKRAARAGRRPIPLNAQHLAAQLHANRQLPWDPTIPPGPPLPRLATALARLSIPDLYPTSTALMRALDVDGLSRGLPYRPSHLRDPLAWFVYRCTQLVQGRLAPARAAGPTGAAPPAPPRAATGSRPDLAETSSDPNPSLLRTASHLPDDLEPAPPPPLVPFVDGMSRAEWLRANRDARRHPGPP